VNKLHLTIMLRRHLILSLSKILSKHKFKNWIP